MHFRWRRLVLKGLMILGAGAIITEGLLGRALRALRRESAGQAWYCELATACSNKLGIDSLFTARPKSRRRSHRGLRSRKDAGARREARDFRLYVTALRRGI
jgi:hypothetical protein